MQVQRANTSPEGEGEQPSKVLLIRLSSLGDVVLVSAPIEALSRDCPEAKISVLTKAEYAPLYEADARVAQVIALDARQGAHGLIRVAGSLRACGYDVIVDLHGNPRSYLLTSLIGGTKTVRYRKRRLARWAMVHAPWLATCVPHTVDAYLDALTGLGLQTRCAPKLWVDPKAVRVVSAFLDQQGVAAEDTLVGVHPGSKWPLKRWTPEGFASVTETLMRRPRIKVVLLGDTADAELVDQIGSRLSRQPVIGVGRFDPGQLVAMIDRCGAVLTNDSGPMHIASALGIPTVALFGPTHPRLGFAPQGPHSKIITVDAPCSPCSLHGEGPCRQKRRWCMEDILPQMVLEAIDDLLRSNRTEPSVSAQKA